MEPDTKTHKELLVAPLLAAQKEARYPYAHERRDARGITLSFCGDGNFEVTREQVDKTTLVIHHGRDPRSALHAFIIAD